MPIDISHTWCSSAGQAAASPVDWSALYAQARAENPPVFDPQGDLVDDSAWESARAPIDADRLAVASHLVRHGGPLVADGRRLSPESALELEAADELPGRLVRFEGLPVCCPECGARVRVAHE